MIAYYKRYTFHDGSLGRENCEADDPGCTIWEVLGQNSHGSNAIICDTLLQAERVDRALIAAFNRGRAARTQELRDFIAGVGIPR